MKGQQEVLHLSECTALISLPHTGIVGGSLGGPLLHSGGGFDQGGHLSITFLQLESQEELGAFSWLTLF